MQNLLARVLALCAFAPAASAAPVPDAHGPCRVDAIAYPDIFGLKFLSRTAESAHDAASNVNFCNVTLIYTHVGENDLVTVNVALPLSGWNQRFVAVGGGGFAGGYFASLPGWVAQGYSAASTDGGHSDSNATGIPTWALVSPGNLDYPAVYDFAVLTPGEMVQIGKAVTKNFHSKAAKYSYWSGCSNGGRQGLTVAQRYPTELDGIYVGAPATKWDRFVVAAYWSQLVENRLGVHPPACEFEAITAAAIKACDAMDGVTDGIISEPNLCYFDPSTLVGTTVACANGPDTTVSADAATIAKATWNGPTRTNGSSLWWGYAPGTNLTLGDVGTNWEFWPGFIEYFVEKRPNFDITAMTYAEFEQVFHKSHVEFESTFGDDDPDLSQFRDAGGKMITWHGLADQLIQPNTTLSYYLDVTKATANVQDFYRYFQAPGVAHCAGGYGFAPLAVFQSLVKWVEHDNAPETLDGTSTFLVNGQTLHRPLCAYPLVARFTGGNSSLPSSYKCASSYT